MFIVVFKVVFLLHRKQALKKKKILKQIITNIKIQNQRGKMYEHKNKLTS